MPKSCEHLDTSVVKTTLETQTHECDWCGESVVRPSYLVWEDVVLADGTTGMVIEDNGAHLVVEVDRQRSNFFAVFAILVGVRREQVVALAGTMHRGLVTV